MLLEDATFIPVAGMARVEGNQEAEPAQNEETMAGGPRTEVTQAGEPAQNEETVVGGQRTEVTQGGEPVQNEDTVARGLRTDEIQEAGPAQNEAQNENPVVPDATETATAGQRAHLVEATKDDSKSKAKIFVSQYARTTLTCVECTKPRIVYTNTKLSTQHYWHFQL